MNFRCAISMSAVLILAGASTVGCTAAVPKGGFTMTSHGGIITQSTLLAAPTNPPSASTPSAGRLSCTQTADLPIGPDLDHTFVPVGSDVDRTSLLTTTQIVSRLSGDVKSTSGHMTCSLGYSSRADAGPIKVTTVGGSPTTIRTAGPPRLVWVVTVPHQFVPPVGGSRAPGVTVSGQYVTVQFFLDAHTGARVGEFDYPDN